MEQECLNLTMEMIPAKNVHLVCLVKPDLLFVLVLMDMNLQEFNVEVGKYIAL